MDESRTAPAAEIFPHVRVIMGMVVSLGTRAPAHRHRAFHPASGQVCHLSGPSWVGGVDFAAARPFLVVGIPPLFDPAVDGDALSSSSPQRSCSSRSAPCSFPTTSRNMRAMRITSCPGGDGFSGCSPSPSCSIISIPDQGTRACGTLRHRVRDPCAHYLVLCTLAALASNRRFQAVFVTLSLIYQLSSILRLFDTLD